MKIINLFILIVFFNTSTFAQEKQRTHTWNFAITEQSSILSTFKDANVALEVWLEDMGEMYDVDIDIKFYKNSDEVFKLFRANKVDYIVIDIPFYFKYRKKIEKYEDHRWSLSIDSEKHSQYYLLANKSKKLKGFADLKNKTLSTKYDDSLARNWMNKKSYELNKSKVEKLLRELRQEKNDRRTLLNVFFGKADYGIISKKAWDDMLSFNPSITKRVEILEKSKKIFIPFIGISSKSLDRRTKELFYKTSKDLKTLKGGEKVIEIVEFNGVYKLKNEELIELDKYFKEYYRLEDKYK